MFIKRELTDLLNKKIIIKGHLIKRGLLKKVYGSNGSKIDVLIKKNWLIVSTH